MNSSDKNRRSTIHADGYSYTEIFDVSEGPDTPSENRLIRVFHALLLDEHDFPLHAELAPKTDAPKAPGEVA